MGDFIPSGQKATAANLKPYHDCWLDMLGNAMWKLYRKKTAIFREKDIARRDEMLYQTLAGYFHPHSEYRKI